MWKIKPYPTIFDLERQWGTVRFDKARQDATDYWEFNDYRDKRQKPLSKLWVEFPDAFEYIMSQAYHEFHELHPDNLEWSSGPYDEKGNQI